MHFSIPNEHKHLELNVKSNKQCTKGEKRRDILPKSKTLKFLHTNIQSYNKLELCPRPSSSGMCLGLGCAKS